MFLAIGNDNCPREVFTKLTGADPPRLKFRRGCLSDLNQRPVADERQGGRAIRHGSADNEVIAAVNKQSGRWNYGGWSYARHRAAFRIRTELEP